MRPKLALVADASEACPGMGVAPPLGAVDCDVHPALMSTKQLLPYLDEHWREQVVERGIDGFGSSCFPPAAPANGRSDWRAEKGLPGSDPARVTKEALDYFNVRFAILNCLYAVQAVHDEYLAASLASGINKWIASEWLDSDPRFRASIVVAPESPELAAKEIEACAADRRFVQVLLLSMAEMPLGRRFYWPIYDAAAKHGLPVAIHAGSALRHAPSASGWPSYLVEDYVNYAEAFQTQILSLITEGVCTRHPNLKFVLTESGFSWLPAFMWRANKSWRALRVETPWVKRAPAEIMRSNFRFTLHPADLPPEPEMLERFIEQMGSDEMLLFSSDYPHWHFDGDQAIPAGLPSSLVAKICHDNPLSTYPRLKEDFE